MRGFLTAAALAVILGASSPARAGLDFDFSFTSTTGSVLGTVTGEIFGLTNNSTSAAADLIIDSYPAGLFLPGTPWDVFTVGGFTVTQNSFTVTGGVITGAVFHAHDGRLGVVGLNNPGGENGLQDDAGNSVFNARGLAGITFTAIATSDVPEPASIALFLSGLFGLRLIRRYKK